MENDIRREGKEGERDKEIDNQTEEMKEGGGHEGTMKKEKGKEKYECIRLHRHTCCIAVSPTGGALS